MLYNFEIAYEDYLIPARFRCPANKRNLTCVLLLHGLFNTKEADGNMFEKLAEKLLLNDIAVLQIDSYSCGESLAPRSKCTVDIMAKEALYVYNYMQRIELVDASKCLILGHSMGGRLAAIIANPNINGIILWNAALGDKYQTPYFLKANMQKILTETYEKGYTVYKNSVNEDVSVYKEFFESLKVSTTDNIYNYKKPILFMIGELDPTVDKNVSIETYRNLDNQSKELIEIKNANHTFNAKTNDLSCLFECIDDVITWIKKCFN